MRRITWVVAIMMMSLVFVLSGCGSKSAKDVVKDLNHVMGNTKSYQGSGVMTLYTGQQPQQYKVEVWYQDPQMYRVALTNQNKEVTQIVLRNKEGVFVLTPHLNKSFRFQSDWPNNQGQVYLFQSLAQSIILDNKREFLKDGKSYVFNVDANYANMSLDRQKVWLSKKDLAPQKVQVMDQNDKVIVNMEFTSFTFNKKFEDGAFDMKKNMASWNAKTLPTITDTNNKTVDQSGKTTDPKAPQDQSKPKQQSFGIIEPSYMPSGVNKQDVSDLKLSGQQAEMIRYNGKYSYTIIETHPKERMVSAFPGTVVDLGFTQAVLTADPNRTISSLYWTNNGVDFMLSTANLPQNEMVKIAKSVQGQLGK